MRSHLRGISKSVGAVLICAVLLSVFAACSAQDDTVLPESGKPVFFLTELPELTPFEMFTEIAERYGDAAYSGELKPADDYGKLYPYEGKLIGHDWFMSVRYGLVDDRGRIVVDPVYERAYYLDEDAKYLCLVYPVEKPDPNSFEPPRRLVVAKADGSWVSGDFFGNWAAFSENRIIVTETLVEGVSHQYKIFDTEGRLIAEGDGYFYGFSGGLGTVMHMKRALPGEEGSSWYEYIDTEGRTAIQGPFIDAQAFEDGKAFVAVGEDWESALYGVINSAGEYVVKPELKYNDVRHLFDGQAGQDIYVYNEERDGVYYEGIKEKDGRIIVPAEYERISYTGVDSKIAIGYNYMNSDFFVISLPDGSVQRIDGNPSNAYVSGNDWLIIEYTGAQNTKILKRGDKEYRFDYLYGEQMWDYFIHGELFAFCYNNMDNNGYINDSRTDIFDADAGKVIKSLPDVQYLYREDRMIVFSRSNNSRLIVLDQDFEPYFPAEAFKGAGGLTSLYSLTDDIYSVRTTFFSGLIRKNGDWLIRVRTQNTD